MPSKSKAQRRLMAMCEHGKATKSKCPKMSKEEMHKYASTKEKGIPMRTGKKGSRGKTSEFSRMLRNQI